MANWTLALLALTGLLVASLPLLAVRRSAQADKYRQLTWVTVFVTFDLIVFGAFTRLTDSGLGCPDWPGCYGLANPFLAHAEISAAAALQPTGPVTLGKAWIEMIHRFLASAIGLLCLILMAWGWRKWRATAGRFAPGLPTAAFLLVCLQGAFGAWTVTMKLQPAIVTTHLILGMLLLALLGWLACRQNGAPASAPSGAPASVSASVPAPMRSGAPALSALRAPALLSAAVLALQMMLGGWVSTNYATLACTEFPLCAGQLLPPMDFGQGFTLWRKLGMTADGAFLPFAALTAIHWVHRNGALVVAAVLGYTAWRAWPQPALRRSARAIAVLLLLQAGSGVATIYLNFPLAIAVLHNAGAALLVLVVAMLNYQTRHPSAAPSRPEPNHHP